jgi:FkbM family methyltransferase
MNKLLQRASMRFLRPYIGRELPGWGRLYSAFVGDYRADHKWAWLGTRWVRGKLHGYEMQLDLGHWSNRQTFFLRRLYDLPTQLILKKLLKAGDIFVDIGANQGGMSLLACRLVGPTGGVISFEPNPRPREIFRANIERNVISNISLLPFGLGDRDGTLQLTVPRINSGEGSFGKSNYKPEDIDVVQCDIRCGDEILSETTPALIKIDVEGFELHVLKGLNATISRTHPPIIMEMISGHLTNCGTKLEDLVSFMISHRYQPFGAGLQRSWFRHDLKLSKISFGSNIEADVLWIHLDDANLGRLVPLPSGTAQGSSALDSAIYRRCWF